MEEIVPMTPPMGASAAGGKQRTAAPHELRGAFRRRAEGVTIITTLDEFGNQWGLTATAVCSVSLDPPLILVCVDNRSGLIGPLTAGASFVVHLLAADQASLAKRFATPIEDKFDGTAYRFTRSGCARLEGALASLECVTQEAHLSGDHTICIGRVTEIDVNHERKEPLVFFDGRLLALACEGWSAAADADPPGGV